MHERLRDVGGGLAGLFGARHVCRFLRFFLGRGSTSGRHRLLQFVEQESPARWKRAVSLVLLEEFVAGAL